MILFFISFISGVLTVLAPCILPLLPIIIGGSLSGEDPRRSKALTVIVSLGISVILFTLLLKVTTLFITVPPSVWTWLSGGIIIAIGLTLLMPSLWGGELLARLSGKAHVALGSGAKKNTFWGDVLIGASLGPVFSTCSPTYFIVLATVLPVNFAKGLLYLGAYVVGLCLSLLVVALVGQRIMMRLGAAADPKGWVKRSFGVLFLIVGVAIITGADKTLQTKILDAGFFDVTHIEQGLLEYQDKAQSAGKPTLDTSNPDTQNSAEKPMLTSDMLGKESVLQKSDKAQKYVKAPEISTPDGFINTDGKPITLEQLRKENKVVLLDIWTYSCINCRRTIPYLNEWYKKYKDQGLVIVGLHTPEFSFEQVQDNVAKASASLGIQYPVVLDNDFSTWRALGNQYWPRKYLIDIDGYIVYDHSGEGSYDETEKAIQKALKERSDRLNEASTVPNDLVKASAQNSEVGSPETYFGAARNEYLANGTGGKEGTQTLTAPASRTPNALYLDGTWNFVPEYAESASAGKIFYKYHAKDIYMVASSETPAEVELYVDGVFSKKITIQADTLYTLAEHEKAGDHEIEIRVPKGVKAFTFTFG